MTDTVEQRSIGVSVGEVTFSRKGRVLRQESYVETLSLLQSLTNIRELSREPHTRNNLQTLINQILELKPSL